MAEYKIYTGLDPRPEDAPKLGKMWAVVKKQKRNYTFRRNLAHDYQLAKCAKATGSASVDRS